MPNGGIGGASLGSRGLAQGAGGGSSRRGEGW